MGIRQSALERLRRRNISAKDIASQAWCEKQMELYILSPMQTQAMAKGAAFHETLKEEVFVPLKLEPITYPDKFYKTAYENYTSLVALQKDGVCREVKLYGSINGFRITGQVDELRMVDGSIMVVEDKTVGDPSVIMPAKTKCDTIQASLYKKLLDDIKNKRYTFENFSKAHAINEMKISGVFADGLKAMGVKTELQTIPGMYKKMFDELMIVPNTGDLLDLRYFERRTNKLISEIKTKYDGSSLDEWIQYSMKYWSGEREAQPVAESENWKCNGCRFFGKECTTWYKKAM